MTFYFMTLFDLRIPWNLWLKAKANPHRGMLVPFNVLFMKGMAFFIKKFTST
jgi:hypothetical protein